MSRPSSVTTEGTSSTLSKTNPATGASSTPPSSMQQSPTLEVDRQLGMTPDVANQSQGTAPRRQTPRPSRKRKSEAEKLADIDMIDIPDPRPERMSVSGTAWKNAPRGWKGWVMVDEQGDEIAPEQAASKQPDPDEQSQNKKRRVSANVDAVTAPAIPPTGAIVAKAGKIVAAAKRSANKVKRTITKAIPENSARLVRGPEKPIKSVGEETSSSAAMTQKPDPNEKTMLKKGLFHSGQPVEEVMPLPHYFYMQKIAPSLDKKRKRDEADDERPLKPHEIFRTFKLGAEVFNPLNEIFARDIKDWHVTRGNKNTLVGDAKHSWERSDLSDLPVSLCVCTPATGCNEHCLNRIMDYECDNSNCKLGADACTNRAFYQLSKRLEKTEAVNNRQRELEKRNAELAGRRTNFHSVLMSFEQGVEVFKTNGKGYGVRAQRSFEPDQIIMEYYGEIIDQDEVSRRMETVYKDSSDFYMMEFQKGFILDATKGSMARFVNHSCEPNCEIRKLLVRKGEGKKATVEPRMALFAKEHIGFDQELTYDYQFEPFSKDTVQECKCGSTKCRGFLIPRNQKDPRQKKKSGGAVAGGKNVS